jgi:hypothetical protein
MWKAVLDGEISKRAWLSIRRIDREIDVLEDKFKVQPHFHLFTAGFGAALFSHYLYQSTKEKKQLQRAHSFLNMASNALGEVAVGDELYSGFTGVAWLAEHFRRARNEKWTKATDPNNEVDKLLMLKSRKGAGPKSPLGMYGLADQWVGYGVYGLERASGQNSAPLAENIVKLLLKKSKKTKNGLSWLTSKMFIPEYDRANYKAGYFNIGVAHGIPGIIGFLASFLRVNPKNRMAKEMLESSIAWLLTHDDGNHFSFNIPLIVSATPPPPGRLAWCYGDLGISVVLLNAARVLKNAKIEEHAIEIAQRSTKFIGEGSRVTDPYLCHGGSGAFHIFNRLYQYTGQEIFLTTALRWLNWAVELEKKPEEGPREYNILTGQTGLGLCLLAGVSNIEPEWDRYLLMS